MTISKRDAPKPERYDWTLLAEMAVQNPGEWFCEDDPDRPSTNSHQIRRGTPGIFSPAGAFDAVSRKEGLYIRYLGVPVEPWVYWDDNRKFDEIARTVDPARFPESTPEPTVDFLLLHTPSKAIKRERKRLEEGATQ